MLVGSFSEKMTMELAEAHQTGDDSTNNISISETVLAATEVNIHEDINIAEVEKEPEYVPDPQKVENIRKYLVGRNSPLADYAIEFVKASDYYGIDYRFVAAISIIESNGGNRCFKPYNAWQDVALKVAQTDTQREEVKAITKRLEQKDYELEQNDTKITQEWVGLGIKGAAELGDLLIGIKKLSKLSKMFK